MPGTRSADIGAVRVPELDGVRALAIAMVVVWHWVHLPAKLEPGTIWSYANIFLRLTWSGVDLFFVLSGFLIGSILLANTGASNYYSVFYFRRACRILPLYLAVLGICTLLAHPGMLPESSVLTAIFRPVIPLWAFYVHGQNIAMAWAGHFGHQALNVTWSLAVEEQFYLLLPLAVRWSGVRLPVVLVVLIAGGAGTRWIMSYLYPERAAFLSYVLLPLRWDPLLLGVLAAWAWRQDRIRTWLYAHTQVLRVALIASGAGWLTLNYTAAGVIMSPFMTRYGYPAVALSWLTVLLFALCSTGLVQRIFRSAPARWLGTVSYGVYIFHEPVNSVAHAVLLDSKVSFSSVASIAVTALALLVTLGAASLSWILFERPFTHLGRRMSYAVEGAGR